MSVLSHGCQSKFQGFIFCLIPFVLLMSAMGGDAVSRRKRALLQRMRYGGRQHGRVTSG